MLLVIQIAVVWTGSVIVKGESVHIHMYMDFIHLYTCIHVPACSCSCVFCAWCMCVYLSSCVCVCVCPLIKILTLVLIIISWEALQSPLACILVFLWYLQKTGLILMISKRKWHLGLWQRSSAACRGSPSPMGDGEPLLLYKNHTWGMVHT